MDLNDSVGENIEKIENFLKADPGLDSEEDDNEGRDGPDTKVVEYPAGFMLFSPCPRPDTIS